MMIKPCLKKLVVPKLDDDKALFEKMVVSKLDDDKASQTCDYVRVQSATQLTASVHALHVSKPVITFVFKVLRKGLLLYILYTCPHR